MDFCVRVLHPSIVTRGETLATCPHPPDDRIERVIVTTRWCVCLWCGGHALSEQQ